MHDYHLPLILTALLHVGLINVAYLTVLYVPLSVTSHINCIVTHCLVNGMCLYQVMMTLHCSVNDVANDAESTQKSKITA